MSVHMSLRLAWHMDGWNGHICKDPTTNTYCVGQHSYPGEMVSKRRELPVENMHKGSCCTNPKLKGYIPPCIYSINAFGTKKIQAFADPPDFFRDNTSRKNWDLAPSTACIWPYEQMYRDEVKLQGTGQQYDYEMRLQYAKDYFGQFEKDKSLIFYYSNYSNPLNQADEKRYVLVGVSRVKKVGDVRFYDDCSERARMPSPRQSGSHSGTCESSARSSRKIDHGSFSATNCRIPWMIERVYDRVVSIKSATCGILRMEAAFGIRHRLTKNRNRLTR